MVRRLQESPNLPLKTPLRRRHWPVSLARKGYYLLGERLAERVKRSLVRERQLLHLEEEVVEVRRLLKRHRSHLGLKVRAHWIRWQKLY
jgi:hypothetical protein